MKMKLRLLLWCVCLLPAFLGIQANNYAILTGKITHPVHEKASLYVITDLLTLDKTIISTPVSPDGSFVLALSADKPLLVRFEHAYENMMIYMVPGERTNVTFEGERMWETIKYTGDGAANNNYLVQYFNKFEKEIDQTYIDINAEGMNSFQFAKYANERKEKQLAFYNQYTASHTFTNGFDNFAMGDIIYNWGFDRLRYAVMQNWLLDDANYFQFLDEVPLQNDHLISSDVYTKFLLAYTDYLEYKERQDKNSLLSHLPSYQQKYDLAKSRLHGNLRYFILAKLLGTACEKGLADEIEVAYNDFLLTNPYPSYTKLISEKYEVANKFSKGQPAPDFILEGLNGDYVALSDYRGKVVYLVFWASWCRPCLQQIKYIKEIDERLASDEVVLLYVSIDEDVAAWKDMVDLKEIPGVHVRTDGVKSLMPQDYNVAGVPLYFMIDKEGNFDSKPPRPSEVDSFIRNIEGLMSAK